MQIRPFELPDATSTHRMLIANGWSHRIPSVEHLMELIAASQHAMVAVEDGRLVGFARAITDGLSNGYLSMVIVDEAWRGRGIGTALVKRIVGEDDQLTWVLRAGRPGAQAFFSKLGFAVSTVAMERVRKASAR